MNQTAGAQDQDAAALSCEGLSPQSPVVIAAATSIVGVPAEYAWLNRRYGTMDHDWKVDLRSLGRDGEGRTIETFRLRLRGGAKVDVHFDVTSFHQL